MREPLKSPCPHMRYDKHPLWWSKHKDGTVDWCEGGKIVELVDVWAEVETRGSDVRGAL